MASFVNGEGNYEGKDSPYQLTIYLKTGDTLWIVNRHDKLIEVANMLMSDNEYDGGDNTIEVSGVKFVPHLVATTVFVKPWAVAAIEMNPVKNDLVKQTKGLFS